MSRFTVARVHEIPTRDIWIPIRDHFGIRAFGVNAYRADEAGGRVISDHTETMSKHEELYVVIEGHATFAVDSEEIDARAGTFVFVGDPATRRGAVAKDAGTTVLAAGARPGHAFEVAPWEQTWEENQEAMKLYREERYGEAGDVLREAIKRHPDSAGLYYNLACFDSKAGADVATVVESLSRAIELYPGFRDFAREDSDFEPVRDDPAIQALVGEPPASAPQEEAAANYAATHLDQIEETPYRESRLRPVRHHFGITAFGVNAWTAHAAGDRLIPEHEETDGSEELYLVLRGRAVFELDGERLDAPVGTLVFVRPGVKRTAFAEEAEASIVALGAIRGRAYVPAGWEIWGELYEAGEYGEAAERVREVIAAHPEYAVKPPYAALFYNVACFESLSGRPADALEHLRHALEISENLRELAQSDSDLDPIRDEPAFKQLVGS